MAESRIVVEGLREFQRALKSYAPEVHKEFRTSMRGLAGVIVAAARSLASWSSRIPSAIGPSVTTKGVGVRVSKKRAPHGPLYELGSKGNAGMVRHPLFGNRNFWYSTPVRPFLRPAVRANREMARRRMVEATEEAARKVGLR